MNQDLTKEIAQLAKDKKGDMWLAYLWGCSQALLKEKDLEIKESFIDLLNDIYPSVKIGYSTFTPAEILECCDPIAFAIGLVEHEDYLAELEDES